MSDPGIRESESERQIFHDIFLSLESKRTAKSEKDILDAVQEKFGLPGDRKSWPDVLIANGTPVEKVLDFVFEQLGPFAAARRVRRQAPQARRRVRRFRPRRDR